MSPTDMPQKRPQWMLDSSSVGEPKTVRQTLDHIHDVKVLDKDAHLIRMSLRKEA